MEKILTWSGPLSIENAPACQAELRAAMDAATEVAIDLRECTSIDLSVLQLLCAGQRHARRFDKQLHLRGCDSAVITTAATENGFFRTAPCHVECGSLCLWLTAAVA